MTDDIVTRYHGATVTGAGIRSKSLPLTISNQKTYQANASARGMAAQGQQFWPTKTWFQNKTNNIIVYGAAQLRRSIYPNYKISLAPCLKDKL